MQNVTVRVETTGGCLSLGTASQEPPEDDYMSEEASNRRWWRKAALNEFVVREGPVPLSSQVDNLYR